MNREGCDLGYQPAPAKIYVISACWILCAMCVLRIDSYLCQDSKGYCTQQVFGVVGLYMGLASSYAVTEPSYAATLLYTAGCLPLTFAPPPPPALLPRRPWWLPQHLQPLLLLLPPPAWSAAGWKQEFDSRIVGQVRYSRPGKAQPTPC